MSWAEAVSSKTNLYVLDAEAAGEDSSDRKNKSESEPT